MKISGIYKIQSLIKPERVYIGSAINIAHRWECHLSDLRLNKHHSRQLQRHFNKYNSIDLQFSILLGCEKEDLLKTEQYFIDSYNPYFNCCKIAGSSIGRKMSEETKQKLRIVNLGKTTSSEQRKKTSASMKGKNTWSKGRPSWNKGKKGLQTAWNKDTKGLMTGMKGKHHSEETKCKISETKKRLFQLKKTA